MRDLSKEGSVPGLETLVSANPDIVLLTHVDFDAGLAALSGMQTRLKKDGLDLPHSFAARPNTGMPTELDLDGDGRLGGPRDAQGYGWFSGQGGQAILSRWPMRLVADQSTLLWENAPETLMRREDTGAGIQRLSTSAHWAIEVAHPDGPIMLLTVSATPPVFDGPEDRNGRRNRDEVLLWLHALNGALPPDLPSSVILLGNLNLDPERGQGLRATMDDVLAHPRLQDPLPGQATVRWERAGEMRVSYVLPDRRFLVRDAGVSPPEPDAGPHRLVWVDLDLSP
ncbi:endonuclease/exonuclease/phosphatase family protein [Pacificoceanicola onchidii]|uniref:endonuclease/exonuclease/phosphatase family protein n=1 Tax=Pacificoceanicola onchidii TaxID=2562685 RepID=UPI0014562755|nr:endonuclease/exonuclease/phosphatase family protein [Pacificoceanicola onchidii]